MSTLTNPFTSLLLDLEGTLTISRGDHWRHSELQVLRRLFLLIATPRSLDLHCRYSSPPQIPCDICHTYGCRSNAGPKPTVESLLEISIGKWFPIHSLLVPVRHP